MLKGDTNAKANEKLTPEALNSAVSDVQGPLHRLWHRLNLVAKQVLQPHLMNAIQYFLIKYFLFGIQ